MIGAYGEWVASRYTDQPGSLSLRSQNRNDLDAWRDEAVSHTCLLLAEEPKPPLPDISIHDTWEHAGLAIEDLSWQLPYGPRTRAYFLRPARFSKPLPGILALHDHGGKKNWGRQKLVDIPGIPMTGPVRRHREYYGNRAWANFLAESGYAVLVHDAFAFGSRRIRLDDVPWAIRNETRESPLVTPEEIEAYNDWASHHEAIMAKSLFAAGLTWPGVVLYEDRIALDILCSRPEVDQNRVGCGGLSGGGLRTVYLGGLDKRIRVAVCVGMMTTWRDFLLHRSALHTWMVYTPLLAQALDYPEVLGLRVPKPTMVLNNISDPLFTLSEMKRADNQLAEIYRLAGFPQNYEAHFYEGGHKFDLEMQARAHAFLAHHL